MPNDQFSSTYETVNIKEAAKVLLFGIKNDKMSDALKQNSPLRASEQAVSLLASKRRNLLDIRRFFEGAKCRIRFFGCGSNFSGT